MTTMVNFRMDNELKKDMDTLCDNIGLSMSTAFILFAKKFVNEKRMPFEITENTNIKREKFLNSFNALREDAIESGIDMSDDNINNIINDVRKNHV